VKDLGQWQIIYETAKLKMEDKLFGMGKKYLNQSDWLVEPRQSLFYGLQKKNLYLYSFLVFLRDKCPLRAILIYLNIYSFLMLFEANS
jgi:hypothetical protein